ncbi:MAG: hypothetical protein ACI4NA_04385 [Succinivibrio sp.]
MKIAGIAAAACAAAVCIGIGGCSLYNGFIKGTETVMHRTLGLSLGDETLDKLADDYSPYLEGVEFEKMNAIFGYQLRPTMWDQAATVSMLGILSAFDYVSEDCNISLFFDQDEKFYMFRFVIPSMDGPVRVNGKVVDNSMKSGFLKTLAESSQRLPVGKCAAVMARFDKFRQAGGKSLAIPEVISLFKDDNSKQGGDEALQGKSMSDVQSMARQKLQEAAASGQVDPDVMAKLQMVRMQQEAFMKKNTVNGKMRMCLVNGGGSGLVLEATGKDNMVRFQKESDGSVAEVAIDQLEICKD